MRSSLSLSLSARTRFVCMHAQSRECTNTQIRNHRLIHIHSFRPTCIRTDCAAVHSFLHSFHDEVYVCLSWQSAPLTTSSFTSLAQATWQLRSCSRPAPPLAVFRQQTCPISGCPLPPRQQTCPTSGCLQTADLPHLWLTSDSRPAPPLANLRQQTCPISGCLQTADLPHLRLTSDSRPAPSLAVFRQQTCPTSG